MIDLICSALFPAVPDTVPATHYGDGMVLPSPASTPAPANSSSTVNPMSADGAPSTDATERTA